MASLPEEARDARARIPRKLRAQVLDDDHRTLLDFLVRLRNDTFHYASDRPSRRRVRGAMTGCAGEEGTYVIGGRKTRAHYADQVVEEREYPTVGHDRPQRLAAVRDVHEALLDLQDDVATFIKEAEAAYLLEWLPDGVVVVER